jgi:hypothetical protein
MAKSNKPRRVNPDAIRPEKIITPEQLAASGTEDGHQMAVMQWAATARLQGHYPETRKLFAIPLGGKRHIVTAMRMKATGSKKGVPDLMLPVARHKFHGLFIELKLPEYRTRANGGRSDEQIHWGLDLQEEGYSVVVAYGWFEAVSAIVAYLGWK